MGSFPDLPSSRSPTLALVQPTEAELRDQQSKNGEAWKGALSLDAYLRRELFLANQGLARHDGLTAWALVDTAAKERVVLSGCETLRKKALVAKDGVVKEVLCHGVGSVFCPSEFRGRGYAGRMMQELGERLQTWQADEKECLFSVLYSDIGKDFYAARGWHPFPSSHISVPPATNDKKTLSANATLPQSRPLYAEDLATLCALDEKLICHHMTKLANRGKYSVALVPDVETVQWHHAREEFISNELYGKKPDVKGAIVGNEPGKRVWCYWTRMWYNKDPQNSEENTLHILRLVIEDPAVSDFDHQDSANATSQVATAVASLLIAAQAEAAKWTMGAVDIWNPTPSTVAAAQMVHPSAVEVHRDQESITSLKWYGEDPDRAADSIDWIGNEKYGWC
ncbi:hypothetical protein LTR66_001211 [Elasticomyces elasticus]|nr:hypothetical protein LTR50_001085 [Elasticomyces elasticus]KAK4999827.1 hypothetical protein LTR66_001211 [Elasticomyces elasticus]